MHGGIFQKGSELKDDSLSGRLLLSSVRVHIDSYVVKRSDKNSRFANKGCREELPSGTTFYINHLVMDFPLLGRHLRKGNSKFAFNLRETALKQFFNNKICAMW